jgi:RNA-splicing ligase RtcB
MERAMSCKQAVEKISDNHYVLPKVGSMKVEAHGFLSEALFTASEEQVWRQIASGASYEGVTGAYLMPDTHTGYGVPVGSVIVTDGTIIQGGSGYDISCGVIYMKASLSAGGVKSKHARERWVKEVERRIATGKGHHRPDRMPKFSRSEADDILRFGAESLVLPDGTTKRGFVHRKGATRAFPAGHPDLEGTRWAATGHPCLIPGSMYEGAAILFPLPGAHKSACSVNHGSGRLLSRGEAKRKLEHEQQRIDDEMATVRRTFAGVAAEGIVGNHRHVPLDECAHVYKGLDEVLAVLEAEGIARVAHRLYPVANIKGAD